LTETNETRYEHYITVSLYEKKDDRANF